MTASRIDVMSPLIIVPDSPRPGIASLPTTTYNMHGKLSIFALLITNGFTNYSKLRIFPPTRGGIFLVKTILRKLLRDHYCFMPTITTLPLS